jgi:hypothetical protein
VSLADTLADQLGHIRIQREQLGVLEAHLLAAIDVAHDLDQGTISSTATLPGPPPHLVTPVAVDEPDPVPTIHHPEDDCVDADPPAPPATGKKGSKYDLAQVAAIAREATELGISQRKHVHDKLPGCPSPSMAAFLITTARQAGHDIPTAKSVPAPRSSAEAQVPGKRFDCSTCPHSTSTVRDIIRHARADHGRDAYTSERMPV